MRYLVRVNELEQRIDYLQNQIRIIEENIETMNKVKASIVWEGEAYIKFMNNYNTYLNELENIKNDVSLIIRFLIRYHDKYGNAYKSLINKYSINKEAFYGKNII